MGIVHAKKLGEIIKAEGTALRWEGRQDFMGSTVCLLELKILIVKVR